MVQARAVPQVALYRAGATVPYIPSRPANGRFDPLWITGSEAAMLRLQFDPLQAGRVFIVNPGDGVSFQPAAANAGDGTIYRERGRVLRIGTDGACVLSVQLDPALLNGSLFVQLDGVFTLLRIARVSAQELAKVDPTYHLLTPVVTPSPSNP